MFILFIIMNKAPKKQVVKYLNSKKTSQKRAKKQSISNLKVLGQNITYKKLTVYHYPKKRVWLIIFKAA